MPSATIEPKQFGLPPKTILEQIEEKTLALVIRRKSRLIMADGRTIVSKIDKIKAKTPAMQVVVQTNAPVCSKTIAYLAEHGTKVVSLEKDGNQE